MPSLSHFIPRKETWCVYYKRLGRPKGQVLIWRKMSDLLLLVWEIMLQNFIVLCKGVMLKRKIFGQRFSHIIKLLGLNVQSLAFFLNFMIFIGVSNRSIGNVTAEIESWASLIHFSNLHSWLENVGGRWWMHAGTPCWRVLTSALLHKLLTVSVDKSKISILNLQKNISLVYYTFHYLSFAKRLRSW